MQTDSNQDEETKSVEALCADLARTEDRDRWLAALLAPAPVRADLHVLIAFHGELAKIRDLVSEPMLGQIRLQWWREALDEIAAQAAGAHRPEGHLRAHPVAQALAPIIRAGRIDMRRLHSMIDAREADLDEAGFATKADFLTYLDSTAGALNDSALLLMGVDDDSVHAAARQVGRALAIAGHLRSTAINAGRGWVTLPRDVLAAHDVALDALLAGRPGAGLKEAARSLCQDAQAALAAGRKLDKNPPRAGLAVLGLARFAAGYLARIKATGFDLFAARLEPAPVSGPFHVFKTMVTGRY
jgi:phytoene synthase